MLPANLSYTQRRAHGLALDASYPEGGARAVAPHRWRATFSSGGRLAFGSRSVVIASVGALDAACREEVAGASRHRERAALGVAAASASAHPADTFRGYKDAAVVTAGEAPSQSALAEQHAWKLAGALFLPEGGAAAAATAASTSLLADRDGGAAAALQEERKREALRAW